MNENKEKEIVYTGINKLFRSDAVQTLWDSLHDGTIREFLDDWKWIFSYSKKYRLIVIFYTIVGIFGSTASIGSAYVSRLLINIIVGQQHEKLWLLVTLMIGMMVFSLALSSVSSYISARISIYVNNDIQAGIFDRIMDARWKELSAYPSGDLLNRFNGDVGTIAANAINWIPNLVINIYTFAATFVVLWRMDYIMALMAFVCFWNFGVPEPTGFVTALSGFCIPCFYILSGFFVLEDRDDGKLERKLKRSGRLLGAMLLLYLLFNAVLCIINNVAPPISLRTAFNFLVLNLWPLSVGSNIWFIQAMVYAHIVIYIACKLKIMKYYKAVMILCFLIMLATGEFAGLIHFNILGYPYIPGNWLTRALPYILLGKFLREKEDALYNIPKPVYILIFIAGAAMALGELILLGRTGHLIYQGHMIGYGVMAFAACGIALTLTDLMSTRITYFDSALSGLIYVLMDPLYYLIALTAGRISLSAVLYFGGIAAYLVSIIAAAFLCKTKLPGVFFTTRKEMIEREQMAGIELMK